ncbi:MAG: hypothetical protein AAGA77_19850 [Bacteroidota bacterium]
MKNLFFVAATLCAIVLFSCGDSCDLMEFTERADANLELGQAYVADTTTANCNAYADDLQSIIDDYGDCDDETISGQVALFQMALDALDCQ